MWMSSDRKYRPVQEDSCTLGDQCYRERERSYHHGDSYLNRQKCLMDDIALVFLKYHFYYMLFILFSNKEISLRAGTIIGGDPN